MVKINQVGTLYEVRFAYDTSMIEAMKLLGGKWDKANRCWVLGDSESVTLLNRAIAYRDTLPIPQHIVGAGPRILAAVNHLLRQQEAGVSLEWGLLNSDALTPDPMRSVGKSLKDFQLEPVRRLNEWGNLLLADEMGCGKTPESISCINAAPETKRVLIICPANLKRMWFQSLKGDSATGSPGWLRNSDLTVGIAQGSYFPPTDIVIINFDILERHKAAIDAVDWDFCLIDECHYIKSPKAKRTKCIIGGGTRKAQIKPIRAGRKIAMSGTPLVNKPEEIWAVLNWLSPREWPSRFWFEQKFCGVGKKIIGKEWCPDTQTWEPKYAREVLPPSPAQLKELNQRLRSTIMLRRTKKEVLSHLPPKLRQVIEFEIPSTGALVAKEQKLLADARSGAIALRANLASARVSGTDVEYRAAIKALADYQRQAQAHVARIRHDLAVAKVPHVVDHVRNALLDPDQKVIVFAHHRAALKSLYTQFAELGYNPVMLIGGVSDAEKQTAESRFQTDPMCRVFVGGLTCAGVGLTLTAANLVVFAELDWVPGNVSQCEDRAHRIGAEIHNHVLVQHLVAYGSLDARIAKTLVQKQEILDAVLDDQSSLSLWEPIDWLAESRDAEPAPMREELEIELDDYHKTVYSYGLKRLVETPGAFGVTDTDLIVASRLAGRELTGPEAAMAQFLARKYLGESA